jgi:hypothetical protein
MQLQYMYLVSNGKVNNSTILVRMVLLSKYIIMMGPQVTSAYKMKYVLFIPA